MRKTPNNDRGNRVARANVELSGREGRRQAGREAGIQAGMAILEWVHMEWVHNREPERPASH